MEYTGDFTILKQPKFVSDSFSKLHDKSAQIDSELNRTRSSFIKIQSQNSKIQKKLSETSKVQEELKWRKKDI